LTPGKVLVMFFISSRIFAMVFLRFSPDRGKYSDRKS